MKFCKRFNKKKLLRILSVQLSAVIPYLLINLSLPARMNPFGQAA